MLDINKGKRKKNGGDASTTNSPIKHQMIFIKPIDKGFSNYEQPNLFLFNTYSNGLQLYFRKKTTLKSLSGYIFNCNKY